jgi:hypothetical protein
MKEPAGHFEQALQTVLAFSLHSELMYCPTLHRRHGITKALLDELQAETRNALPATGSAHVFRTASAYLLHF